VGEVAWPKFQFDIKMKNDKAEATKLTGEIV